MKRLDVRRACLGKTRHKSEMAARIARRNSGVYAADLDVYRCPFCRRYHLGPHMEGK